jgi:hypothetical protein
MVEKHCEITGHKVQLKVRAASDHGELLLFDIKSGTSESNIAIPSYQRLPPTIHCCIEEIHR